VLAHLPTPDIKVEVALALAVFFPNVQPTALEILAPQNVTELMG